MKNLVILLKSSFILPKGIESEFKLNSESSDSKNQKNFLVNLNESGENTSPESSSTFKNSETNNVDEIKTDPIESSNDNIKVF